ncbi:aminopeptidase N, partial [Morganella morganii]|nr:aminopeptidase N [Morganella morganii]
TITLIVPDFAHAPRTTVASAVSRVKRLDDNVSELGLAGDGLTRKQLTIDGKVWSDYREEPGSLRIMNVPEQFTLQIVNGISPAEDTALEGQYVSGDARCT